MLFPSHQFLCLFLPLTVVGYFALGQILAKRSLSQWFLIVASATFYGWSNAIFLPLLLATIAGNYYLGGIISRLPQAGKRRQLVLVAGITINLGILVYYKYTNFFVASLSTWAGFRFTPFDIVLPLAISFHTFQQIAFIVDCFRNRSTASNFREYLLFVLFFPQLIAGPIVLHEQLLPQLRRLSLNWDPRNVALGATLFIIGLSKKVLIADSLAPYSDEFFFSVESWSSPTWIESWIKVLAYTGQIYFDFSGYSDMAIGLARLFNLRLPSNFDSPYQASSIIDFWRRWHMTLSQFLRDYLYIPLGGNRLGTGRRYLNLLITMILGGLWHGASWTFAVWGLLHGCYLAINHGWRHWFPTTARFPGGRILTFGAVVLAWVFFRAPSLGIALAILRGMLGFNGLGVEWLPSLGEIRHLVNLSPAYLTAWVAFALAIAHLAPNSQSILESAETWGNAAGRRRWNPSGGWALVVSFLLVLCLTRLNQVGSFIYFQF